MRARAAKISTTTMLYRKMTATFRRVAAHQIDAQKRAKYGKKHEPHARLA